MESEQYSIAHVISHLKDALLRIYSSHELVLQYKWAKTAQPTTGNKLFQNQLQQSYQNTVIMNATKENKLNPYVKLRSSTQQNQFKWLHINLKMLNKRFPYQVKRKQKIDLNFQGQKISFDSQSSKWTFKSARLLFKPNYEAVKEGKLYRISLTSQFKGTKQPKNKVIDLLQQAISFAIQNQKSQKQHHNNQQETEDAEVTKNSSYMNSKQKNGQRPRIEQTRPLRFKQQTIFELNKCCSIVASRVYQVVNVKIFESILQLVNNERNSHAEQIGRVLLKDMVGSVFEQFKQQLSLQVEFRFSPLFVAQFQDLYAEQIEEILQKTAMIFISLFRDPHQFIPEEIIDDLNSL